MKKRNLIQKMMAVLLAVLLVMGMAQSGVVSVLARDADSNDIGTTEEGTENKLEADDGTEEVVLAPQANNTASGNDWVLDADGKLTISSDDGMADWENYMRGDYEYYTRQVVNVEIQDGVTSLGNNAFYNYGELTGITIADSVTSIAGSAFCGCWKLRKITIPNNVTSISDRMFMNSGLEEITILGSVTSIGEFAFWGCGLKKITIPASVKSIGEKAFIYCDNLNEVIIKSETPPTLGAGVFTDCGFVKDNTQSIHVPEGKAQAYKTAWTDWAAYIADGTATAGEHKHNNVTFTAWTATNSLPTDPGNYYLTDNVTLTETWTVPNGTTTLCLNGKTISASGTDGYRVITINISPVLNLYDCRNTGNITGGKDGGVWNDGTFCMYGGKISGNATQTYNHGGGVWNNNNFYMYGGEISGNTASIGFGGGVETYGEFRMYGGKISGNTAGGSGGGVHINGSGKFIVGGGAVISGNTYSGAENNVYLKDGKTIVLDSEKPLSGSAKIGVTTASAPTEGNPVNITGPNKGDYSRYFHSDNPAYEIVNTNDVVQLTVKAQSHIHSLTLTPAKDATCTEDGNTAYYVCGGNDGCGKWFLDAEGTQEITNKNSVVIAALGHNYGEWTVTKPATAAASGQKERTCRRCSHKETEVIPATGGGSSGDGGSSGGGSSTGDGNSSGAGKVEKDVQTDAKAPDTQISTPKAELENMLLTDEEKQQVQNGTDITIVLEVKDAGDSVNDSDKAAVQQALSSYTVGQYLNIDLYKLAGQTRTDITETAKKIRIVLTVPDSLKNTDSSKTRKFAVIRVHDGRAELLTDLDDSTGTITIETDRFSTYAVVYKDAANGGNDGNNNDDGSDDDNDGTNDNDNSSNNGGNDNGNNNGSNNNGNNNNSNGDNNHNNSDKKDAKSDSQKDDEPKTGDTAPIEMYATLAMIAGFAYLLLYFADRERGMTEETKKELVSRIIRWAKQGGKIRKCLALAAIFVLLAYYHSIGKKTCAEWKEVYGE